MTVYTIGHSHAATTRVLALLQGYQIAMLVDIRSQPYSRFAPQFNREILALSLQQSGIAYLYLGAQLGGRPQREQYRRPDGAIDDTRLVAMPAYLEGLERLQQEATHQRVAMMCAEADYRKCHRYRLVTRSLVGRGVTVAHILHTGELVHTPPEAFAGVADQLHLL
jgi:uncharacterized protein (DUF488 family)